MIKLILIITLVSTVLLIKSKVRAEIKICDTGICPAKALDNGNGAALDGENSPIINETINHNSKNDGSQTDESLTFDDAVLYMDSSQK